MPYARFAVSRMDDSLFCGADVRFLADTLTRHDAKGALIGAVPSAEVTYILPDNSSTEGIGKELRQNGYRFSRK